MPLFDPYGRPLERQEREDAWANPQTGLGIMGLDKSRAAAFLPPWRVLDQELTSLYNGSDIAAKIVGKRPEEMFRRGFEVEAPGIDASATDDVREYASERLDLETNLREGKRWGRLYGGCLLYMNIDDGRMPWEPLDEENIRSFDAISLVDRRYSYVQSQYSGMGAGSSKYGRAQIYLISNAVAGYGWNEYASKSIEKVPERELRERGAQVALVHETRCIRFDGNPADVVTRQNLAGWSWSVLQRVYDAMRQFDGAFDAAGYLLSDASQGVIKLQGLFKAITAGQRAALTARMQLMDQSRSVLRSIVLDAGGPDGKNAEDFTRVPTPFSGIPELLDRMMLRMCAAADIPPQEIFGQGGGGLNAAGEAQAAVRKWYDGIESEQQNELGPQIKRVFRLLSLAKKGPLKGRDLKWKVHFKPLWSPTDKELAETRYANAQRDAIYIEQGVVKPEEVAVDLFEVYPNLDIEAREKVLEAGLMFDPYENEPSPESAAGIAGKTGGEPLSPKTPVSLMGTTGTQIAKGAMPAIAASQAAAQGADPPNKPKTPAKEEKKDAGDAVAAARLVLDSVAPIRADIEIARAVYEALLEDYHRVMRDDGADKKAKEVYEQLSEDYPTRFLGWVLSGHWHGPVEIPTDQIDSSNRDKWTASHDGRLESFKDKIREGVRKPAIIVKVPDNPLYIIVDGHHRFLGNEAVGLPLLAYWADLHVNHGPWTTLHDSQRSGKSGPSDVGPSWRALVTAADQNPSRSDGGVAFAGDLVETPHGTARVMKSVTKRAGALVFQARAEPASDGNDGGTRVRIRKEDIHPAGLAEAEQKAHSRARNEGLPREHRAAAHAIALAVREHAAKLRSSR